MEVQVSTFERRRKSIIANLGIIHGELRRLIEDMGTDSHPLTPTESMIYGRLRNENTKLDTLIREMKT
jgi:hypothetical protein